MKEIIVCFVSVFMIGAFVTSRAIAQSVATETPANGSDVVIKLLSAAASGTTSPDPFFPNACDGVILSAKNPKQGSYKIPYLMDGSDVVFQLEQQAVIERIEITSSFGLTKRMAVDLLMDEKWVRVADDLVVTFSVGKPIPIMFTDRKLGSASALRLHSYSNHFFIDEITVFASSAWRP